MRSTIIVGSVLALVGFASMAQASDPNNVNDPNSARVHREVSDDVRAERHPQRTDRTRDRHDETSERQRKPRETHDESADWRDHR